MVALFAAVTIVVFVLIDLVLQTIQARRGQETYGFFTPDPIPIGAVEQELEDTRLAARLKAAGRALPSGLFFHRGHTWAAIDTFGETQVGIDDFAQRVMGRLDAVELPEVGRKVRQGEKLFSVRQGQRVADFVSPVEGTISSVNEAITRDTTSLKEDPYRQGWICKLAPSNLSANVKKLKIAEDAAQWIHGEMLKLYNALMRATPQLQSVGVTMHDGGMSLDEVLEHLDDEMWTIFRRDFLANGD